MIGPRLWVNVADGQFRLVAKFWFLDRSAARALVTVILAGPPGYLAAVSDSGGWPGGWGAAWAVLGAALSIGYGRIGGDTIAASATS